MVRLIELKLRVMVSVTDDFYDMDHGSWIMENGSSKSDTQIWRVGRKRGP